MLFREMNYVYEVYRHGSFTRAAQILFLSQPPLSQMVKKAEARVGGPIFDRSTAPISLTELGRAYIRAAQQIMEVESAFRQYLDDTEQCLTGALTLGGTTFFTSYILPPLISAFSARYPNVDLRLHEAHTAMLKRELQEGTLDLVVDNSVFPPEVYQSRVYQEEQVILAVPGQFPVNEGLTEFRLTAEELAAPGAVSRAPVPLEVFSGTPFLLLKEGNDTRARADKLFALAGFQPRIRLLLDQQLAAYHLAAYGLGATFISDTLARRAPPDERLCFYALADGHARRSIRFFYKTNRVLSAPARAFLDMLALPEGA